MDEEDLVFEQEGIRPDDRLRIFSLRYLANCIIVAIIGGILGSLAVYFFG